MVNQVNKGLLIVLLITLSTILSGQECKVLFPRLDSAYAGPCRKGLAHGNGEAWGSDHYYGEFSKGYPDGKGTYEYSDGAEYKGDMKKGLRHGFGELRLNENGKDTVYTGRWINDEYKGPAHEGPGYRIIRKVGVERTRIYRQSDGNMIRFRTAMPSNTSSNIADLLLSGDSGYEFNYNNDIGYENMNYPFRGKISYVKWNKLKTARIQVIVEIELIQPGDWVVEIY